jgi:hypothetical protein
MNKRIVSICCILCLLASPATKAQFYLYDNNYYEGEFHVDLGLSAGAINCLTDLGGRKGGGKPFIKDLNPGNTRMAWGIFATLTYRNVIGLRLEGTFGRVEASDAVLKPVAATTGGRYERNLHFRSQIADFQLSAEVHPLMINRNFDKGPLLLSPYVVGGIGLFSFNPQAQLNGRWIDLRPLKTEGQGFRENPGRNNYSRLQANVPLGIGVKYEASRTINLRLELVHRVLFTDYLDDVSSRYIDAAAFAANLTPAEAALAQRLHDRRAELTPGALPKPGGIRGNPDNNDAFFSLMFKISYMLGRMRR